MNPRFSPFWIGLISLTTALTGLSWGQEGQPAAEEGISVQTTGPVHEAYARPVQEGAQAGLVIAKHPPDPVPEEPPDVKPSDESVWLPGYWAWQPDVNDFLWVSGFWRRPPPGQRWVPGYWTQIEAGWQWTTGFWTTAQQEQVSYYPAPPASLDNGPVTPAPSNDDIYVPGNWVYRDTGFAWRPGHWMPGQADWVWNPACYTWSPSGYVYTEGFWDYPLINRGVLFCPVRFERPLWQTAGWFFRPSYVCRPETLLTELFVFPRYCHYFFGDCYAPDFVRLGCTPWVSYGLRHNDPLFTFERFTHREDRGYIDNLAAINRGRLEGTIPRPPRTLAEQHALLSNARTLQNNSITVGGRRQVIDNRDLLNTATTLNQFARNNQHLRLERLNAGELQNQRAHVDHFRNLQSERSRFEKTALSGTRPGTGHEAEVKAFRLPAAPAGFAHSETAGPRPPEHQGPARFTGTNSVNHNQPGPANHPVGPVQTHETPHPFAPQTEALPHHNGQPQGHELPREVAPHNNPQFHQPLHQAPQNVAPQFHDSSRPMTPQNPAPQHQPAPQFHQVPTAPEVHQQNNFRAPPPVQQQPAPPVHQAAPVHQAPPAQHFERPPQHPQEHPKDGPHSGQSARAVAQPQQLARSAVPQTRLVHQTSQPHAAAPAHVAAPPQRSAPSAHANAPAKGAQNKKHA